MIRPLEEKDFDIVCSIVNENWKNVYSVYITPLLLNRNGCEERTRQLKLDFTTHRLSEYVWEEQNQVLAMLSFGETSDTDIENAFEIWRIYIAGQAQRKGIGKQLLDFAEQQAKQQGYRNIVIWAFKNNYRAISFYQKNGYCIDKEKYLGEPYLAMGTRLKKEI